METQPWYHNGQVIAQIKVTCFNDNVYHIDVIKSEDETTYGLLEALNDGPYEARGTPSNDLRDIQKDCGELVESILEWER